MNKSIPVVLALFTLINPHVAAQTVYAASANHTNVSTVKLNVPTLTLNDVVTPASTSTLQEVAIQPQVVAPVVVVAVPETPQQTAERLVSATFGSGHYKAFAAIVNRESTWNPNAVNPVTGACGLAQANPCSKLQDHSVTGQLTWMISYIKNRYSTPESAWNHELHKGWY